MWRMKKEEMIKEDEVIKEIGNKGRKYTYELLSTDKINVYFKKVSLELISCQNFPIMYTIA